MSTGESPLVSIYGTGSAEKKAELRANFDANFQAQAFTSFPPDFGEIIKRNEIPHTPEQDEVIDLCNEIIGDYFAELKLPFTPLSHQHVKILPDEVYLAATARDSGSPGISSPSHQVIFLRQGSIAGEPLSYFASTTLHEMIQLSGRSSWFISEHLRNDTDTHVRQWGTQVYRALHIGGDPEENRRGDGLDEAIISDMQKLLFKKLFARRPFKKERDAVQKGAEKRAIAQYAHGLNMPVDEIYRVPIRRGDAEGALHFPYLAQRNVLNYVIDEIHTTSPSAFRSRTEVQQMFHRCRIDLNLFPLARHVRRVFGSEGLKLLFVMRGESDDTTQIISRLKQLRNT